MDDADCYISDIESALQTFEKHIRAYKSNPSAPSARSSIESAELSLSKAKTLEERTERLIKTFTGLDARKVQQSFKILQIKIAGATQELEQAKQRVDTKKTNKATTLDDLMTRASQKKQENIGLLSDVNRNCGEAEVVGHAIVDNLEKQNEQLKSIGNRATNIQGNAKGGSVITKRMIKCERIIKIVLWCASILFIGLSALGFYVFHHNVVQNDPIPTPDPIPDPSNVN